MNMNRPAIALVRSLWAALWIASALSCSTKGDFSENRPPETRFSIDKIDLSGDDRLNSRVELSWFGTDIDGYVAGFEISTDSLNWLFTEKNDSVFRFELPEGADTVDIDLWIRALDDAGAVDPTPDRLRIPLKNSPPFCSFDAKSLPGDTALAVISFRWTAGDPDGAGGLNKAYLRLNQDDWFEIDKNQGLVSLVADTANPGTAFVYYGTRRQPESLKVEGLNLSGLNTLFLRVTDLAGAESALDSSGTIFLKPKTSDLLVVGAQPASVRSVYLSTLQSTNTSYDLLDCHANNSASAPRLWDPTFDLILGLYKKALIYSDASTLPPNPVSGLEAALLSHIAPAVQRYTDKGGRSFTTTSFAANSDLTAVIGAFPIDGLVVSVGQARIAPDSGLYALDTLRYPELKPIFFDFGVDPIVRSVDSEDFYRGRLTKLSGWSGDNLVATLRRNASGKPQQVFFSVELHKYNSDPQALSELFDTLLNDDFNGN